MKLTDLTWEHWLQPDVLMILGVFYFVYLWGLPMLGCSSQSSYPGENRIPYWKAVREISLAFHIGTILAVIAMYFFIPYLYI